MNFGEQSKQMVKLHFSHEYRNEGIVNAEDHIRINFFYHIVQVWFHFMTFSNKVMNDLMFPVSSVTQMNIEY
jgi:hypothetical protein